VWHGLETGHSNQPKTALKQDIGYAFLSAHHHKGYATEAVKAVMAYGKTTVGLKRIVGITAVVNQHSIKVLEKAGLRFEKRLTMPGDDEAVMLFGWDAG